jgi:hypothetical protein
VHIDFRGRAPRSRTVIAQISPTSPIPACAPRDAYGFHVALEQVISTLECDWRVGFSEMERILKVAGLNQLARSAGVSGRVFDVAHERHSVVWVRDVLTIHHPTGGVSATFARWADHMGVPEVIEELETQHAVCCLRAWQATLIATVRSARERPPARSRQAPAASSTAAPAVDAPQPGAPRRRGRPVSENSARQRVRRFLAQAIRPLRTKEVGLAMKRAGCPILVQNWSGLLSCLVRRYPDEIQRFEDRDGTVRFGARRTSTNPSA